MKKPFVLPLEILLKILIALFACLTLVSCATAESSAPAKTGEPVVLSGPYVQVKLLYDVDKDGNTGNFRVVNRDAIKDEQFITNAIGMMRKRKYSGRQTPPLKDVEATVDFKPVQ